jgi:hypothetical protein
MRFTAADSVAAEDDSAVCPPKRVHADLAP